MESILHRSIGYQPRNDPSPGETMLSNFIVPETVVREAGTSAELDLQQSPSGLILLTLGITRILEQESLDLSIWGSPDNTDWGAKPLVAFPQKFYCGTYQILLDLTQRPEVKHLRAKWQVNRWGKGESKPLFGFYLFAQEVQRTAIAKSA